MVVAAPKLTTGRRKGAVARIRLVPGDGGFTVNGRPIDEYFPTRVHRMVARGPLTAIDRERDYDVIATIRGGGSPARPGPCASASRGRWWSSTPSSARSSRPRGTSGATPARRNAASTV